MRGACEIVLWNEYLSETADEIEFFEKARQDKVGVAIEKMRQNDERERLKAERVETQQSKSDRLQAKLSSRERERLQTDESGLETGSHDFGVRTIGDSERCTNSQKSIFGSEVHLGLAVGIPKLKQELPKFSATRESINDYDFGVRTIGDSERCTNSQKSIFGSEVHLGLADFSTGLSLEHQSNFASNFC
jgi:copper oxidase (laccase) domain-containing protein